MRNLHHIGIRYNHPLFISILAELNIIVDLEKDKNALRRFIIGQNMQNPIQPIKTLVTRSVSFPFSLESHNHIDLLLNSQKEELQHKISEFNIDPESITNIDPFIQDNQLFFEISFNQIETEQELSIRQRYFDIFSLLLSKQSEIYQKCDNTKF